MRILIVGAGAIGGYFGARLASRRAATSRFWCARDARNILREHGLVVRSPVGDVKIDRPSPRHGAGDAEARLRSRDRHLQGL